MEHPPEQVFFSHGRDALGRLVIRGDVYYLYSETLKYNKWNLRTKLAVFFYKGICFEKILSLGKINSCDHSFHYKCIYRWSRISNNCPTCRIGFSEICNVKANKILKRIKIYEDSHSTEEDVSNSDIEEWQAICPICQSSDEECLLICEGEYGCSNVCHSYCLNIRPTPTRWICQDCEVQESESLADEESSSGEKSSEICSDLDSDPDAEYQPVPESPVLRRSTRKAKRTSRRIKFETSSEESAASSDSDNSNSTDSNRYGNRPSRKTKPLTINLRKSLIDQQSLLACKLPRKRNRDEVQSNYKDLKHFVNNFVKTEIRKELENFPGDRLNADRIERVLIGIISNNKRLSDYQDPRTVQKMKTVIKNYVAGLI